MTKNSPKHDQTSFTHLNSAGEVNMVDVSDKVETARLAIAQSRIVLGPQVLAKVMSGGVAKGDLLATARIAGIQAAKKCSDLIPLCHPLPLTKVSIEIEPFGDVQDQNNKVGLEITALCKTSGKTGVEMEALTAASVAALTIYDMCKALDKGLVIQNIQLLEKKGGKSGHWIRDGVNEDD